MDHKEVQLRKDIVGKKGLIGGGGGGGCNGIK